jgi:hypothetical protein
MLGNFIKKIISNHKNVSFTNITPYYGKEFNTYDIIELLNDSTYINILYYPSSGLDVSDVHYINSKKIPELKIESPNVYIHSDSYNLNYITRLLNYPVYQLLAGYKWESSDEKEIYILKYRRNGIESDFWFIYLRCFCDEIILKSFLLNKLKIDLIYCLSEIPSSIYYPFLAKELGIKYIISQNTQQSLMHYPESTISDLIKNINNLHSNIKISISDLEKLPQMVKETFISTDDKLKLYSQEINNKFWIREIL